jgi:transcriptional regulator with XRE-family HTH domain
MELDMSTLAKRMVSMRFLRDGMSQSDLAKKAGVTLGTVARAEHGDGYPRVETIENIADALGVSAHWLLWGEDASK